LTVIDTSPKVINIKAREMPPSRTITNNSKGFKELAQWVKTYHKEPKLPVVDLMNATSVYYENLVWFLHHFGCHVTVILP
jgi:transposase